MSESSVVKINQIPYRHVSEAGAPPRIRPECLTEEYLRIQMVPVCTADTAKTAQYLVSPPDIGTSSKNMARVKLHPLRISERVQFGIYFAYRQQQIPHLFCRQTKLERI